MRLLIELTYGRCRCRTCRMDRIEWHWSMALATPGSFGIRFAPWPPICRHPDPVRACRACGCWQYDACVHEEDEEPCHWAEPDLCSACARRPADQQALIPPMDDLAHPA